MKQGAKYAGGALLAVTLLWFVLRGKDPEAIRQALAQASLPGLLAAAALNLGHNYFRVVRWGLLLRPVRPQVSFRARFSAVMIGYLTTWVVPGRLGEVVRPALLSAREKLPLGACLGSVVADRLLDGVAIVALFAVGMLLTPLEGGARAYAATIRAAALAAVAVIAAALVALVLVGSARGRIRAWVDRRSSAFMRSAGRLFLSATEGAEALRRPRLLAPILAHSVLAWLAIAFGTWIGVRASGAQVPWTAILVLLPPLALGVALPTPGGAGGYHAAMSLGLVHLFGVAEGPAVGAGILMHLMVTLPVIVLGLVLLKLDGLSWREMRAAVRDGTAGGPNASSHGSAAESLS